MKQNTKLKRECISGKYIDEKGELLNKRAVGRIGEKMAREYLLQQGYFIVKMNYSCKIGEIDIIASKRDVIVFVEVKYRKNSSFGVSFEAVDRKKQYKIRNVAEYYITYELEKTDVNCRFDVIGIDNGNITHIENAF